jgi:hypothetical protein
VTPRRFLLDLTESTMCLRQFYMYTGCRKHELIYAKPRDLEAKVKEYDEELDAYTDVDCTTDKYIKLRVKTYWGVR